MNQLATHSITLLSVAQDSKMKSILRIGVRYTRSITNYRPFTEYKKWLSQTPRPGSAPAHTVVVSVLMATYNTPVDYLKIAIASVLAQSCPNWELSIVDDASSSEGTLNYLSSISELDPRIKIHLKIANGGISDSLNKAIEQSSGDFLGVLDHDDALHPRAIEYCLNALAENPHAILIYSDEDKIDERDRHSNPFFKPDFSPELLLSQMYLNHFTIMRSTEVKKIGGFRTEFDGAQDHDLVLRLDLTEKNVVHVPRVLYHWRAWEESTAMSIDAKPWAQTAAQKVQVAAMQANGIGGSSKASKIKGLNDVHWNVSGKPKVGIVIPTASRMDLGSQELLIDQCLKSLRTSTGKSEIKICIVHTGKISGVQEFTYLNSGYKTIPFDLDKFNFSHAVNLGVLNIDAEYILLLNDDTRMLDPMSIDYMVEYAQNPEVGVVGAKLSYPNGKIQHAGILNIQGLPTHPFHNRAKQEYGYYGSILTPRNYLAVTAAAAMVRKSIFTEVDGFDTSFAHDYNDVDFCLRIRNLGYRNVWTPHAHFEHVEGASIVRSKANPEETELFQSRFEGQFDLDPYYSQRLKQDIRHLYEYK